MRRATLKQTKSSVNTANYTVLEGGANIFEIHSNYIGKNIGAPISVTDGKMTFSLHRTIPDRLSRIEKCDFMSIYAGDTNIGSIWQDRVFIHGLCTYTVQWQKRFFTIYSVGLGKKGFKLPIYEHGKQVALVEKGNVVLDLLDQYELYTNEDSMLAMVILFACFYDRTENSNAGKTVMSSKEYSWAFSLNPKEREKYHEEWVTPFLTQREIDARAKIVQKKPPRQWLMTLASWLPVIMLVIFVLFVICFLPNNRFVLVLICGWLILGAFIDWRKHKRRR